jgi:hypothetical protein
MKCAAALVVQLGSVIIEAHFEECRVPSTRKGPPEKIVAKTGMYSMTNFELLGWPTLKKEHRAIPVAWINLHKKASHFREPTNT